MFLLKISTNDQSKASSPSVAASPSLFPLDLHMIFKIIFELIVFKSFSQVEALKDYPSVEVLKDHEMEFTSMDLKYNYTDQRSFQACQIEKKQESGKSFIEGEMLSKRTPKCARL